MGLGAKFTYFLPALGTAVTSHLCVHKQTRGEGNLSFFVKMAKNDQCSVFLKGLNLSY